MKYRVVTAFVDLQDNKYRYEVGDTYPRKGKKTSKKRIAELSTSENRRNTVMIVPEDEEAAEDEVE